MLYTLHVSNWLVSVALSFWRTGDLTRPVSHCEGGSPGDDSFAGGGLEGCCWERLTVLPLYTNWKHQAFRVACSEPMHCVNAFKMDSNILSLVTQFLASRPIAFLAGIMSLSVDHSVRSILLLCADCWHTVSHSVCRQRGCYPQQLSTKFICDSCVIRPPLFYFSTAFTSWKTREPRGITFPVSK